MSKVSRYFLTFLAILYIFISLTGNTLEVTWYMDGDRQNYPKADFTRIHNWAVLRQGGRVVCEG